MQRLGTKVTSKGPGVVIVWTTELGWHVLPALLRTFLRHGRFKLYFTGVAPGGLALAWLLRGTKILASPARRVELTGQSQRVDDPQSSRFLVHPWLPNEFTRRFFENYETLLAGLAYPDPRVRADRVSTNLRKEVAATTHELVDLVESARYQQQTEGTPIRRLIIVSRVAVLANMIRPGWAGQDVEFFCPWSKQHSLLLRLGRGVLQCLVESVRRRGLRSGMPSSIAVAPVWGLDRSARLNDLYWWWDSGIDPEQVILCFDRPDQPASREAVAQAEQLGIRCIVLNRQAVGDSPQLLWRPAPGPAVSILRLWRNLRVLCWSILHGAAGRWAGCRVLDMTYHAGSLEDFLVEFNVRGLFHYQEPGLDYPSLACDAAGAARIGHHWSYFPWPEVRVARLHQVFFTWGQHYADILDEVGSCVDHVLVSGCIVRGAQSSNNISQDVLQSRDLVISHGATRVLTLLDIDLPCERFYEFFLRRTIQDRRWGLLIKPKTPTSPPWVRRHLPELQALYEQALATGRVQMLDPLLSPADAAVAADFTVAVDINSGAVVSALAGCRSIHLDYVRLQDSPLSNWAKLYKAGADRLVFNDPTKLWDSLNRYFDEPGWNPTLGVADDTVLDEIDPFRDGGAGQRIGEYLRWYLQGLDDGLDLDLALGQADRRYANKWGNAMVVRGLTDDSATAADTAAVSSLVDGLSRRG